MCETELLSITIQTLGPNANDVIVKTSYHLHGPNFKNEADSMQMKTANKSVCFWFTSVTESIHTTMQNHYSRR